MTEKYTNPTSTKQLIAYFDKMLPLTEEQRELVIAKFQPRLYRKRQFILQEGDVCTVFNFVVTGCLRMYKIDEAGTTHIIQFATENWWISDMGSFYSTNPSELNIEAIEDTTVLQIKHNDLLDLYIQAPKFDRLFRVLVENSLIGMQNRLLQTIGSDARVRYEAFLKQYPQLANRIPNTHIASYLGITPEFLSKIRNERVSG
ncbi:MAG TPA: Crp/Fnr family transcriptional regulator [Bacteroidia bacterium]|jgi:CRP-like cAMP-binding protein